jgi:hypothetical protein
MKTVFINADSIVVNVISGALTEQAKTGFLRDYGILYGAVMLLEVDDSTSVWIGGAYTDGVFAPPPEPEPVPEVLPEPLPEVITEPEL